MYLPERLLSLGKKRWKDLRNKKRENRCYVMGENCQQVLLIGAYFTQCWCVVVLVHICLFNHPFFPLGGVGYHGWGWVLFTKDRSKKNRVFCYCPIRGWQYVYIYIVYMWRKCVCFLCDTTFYLYYGSTFSVLVLIIYIWFVFLFFCFVWFLSLSFLVFYFSYLSFLFIARFITFVVQLGDTATLCIRLVL